MQPPNQRNNGACQAHLAQCRRRMVALSSVWRGSAFPRTWIGSISRFLERLFRMEPQQDVIELPDRSPIRLRLAALEALVADLQAHAKEHGWQDVDEPIAALLAWGDAQ